MINQIKAAGGELLNATEGYENHGSGANDATITLYVQAVYQVAATNGIPVVDNYSRQSRAAFVNTAGWLYTDNVHYNAQGYADIAEGYLRFLVSAL